MIIYCIYAILFWGLIQLLFMLLLEMPPVRRKIDEPKTPWANSPVSSEDEVPWKKGWHGIIAAKVGGQLKGPRRPRALLNAKRRFHAGDSCKSLPSRTVRPIRPIHESSLAENGIRVNLQKHQLCIIAKQTTDPGRSPNLSIVYKQ